MSFKSEVEFCFNFLRLQDPSNKSSIYSPISMLNSLAMIYVGAEGNTADEIAKVIGNEKNKNEIINYYSEFIKRNKMIKDTISLSKNDNKIDSFEPGPCEIEKPEMKAAEMAESEHQETGNFANISDVEKAKAFEESSSDLLEPPPPKKSNFRSPKSKVKTKKDDGVAFEILMANKLFIDKNMRLLDYFKKVMEEKFDGHFQQLNFKENKNEAVKIMNNFVNDATKERIKKVFEPNDIGENTGVILVNAIYFIGKWAKPFQLRRKGIFLSKIPREMDLMSTTLYGDGINYTEGKNWQCVGIPYRNNKIWMFIILPKENDGLNNLVNQIDFSMFKEFTKYSTSGPVKVTIPVFEICGDYDLVKNFPELGMNDLFHKFHCDLSKMVDQTYHNENYFVNEAVHKAFIKVDEYGTEAAAVTGSRLVPGCKPKIFKADRPFIYAIVSVDRSEETQNYQSEGLGKSRQSNQKGRQSISRQSRVFRGKIKRQRLITINRLLSKF